MRPAFAFSRSRLMALSCSVLTLTWAPVGATAQTAVSATGNMLEYTVCGTAATFPLDVSTGTPTMVELPGGFDQFLHDDATRWVVKRDGNKLYIAAPRDTPTGEELALRIRATRPVPFETSLHTRAVRRVRGIDDNVVIYHQSDEKRFGAHPEDNPCISRGTSPTQRLRIRAFDRQHSKSRAIGVPEIDHVARSRHGVPIELTMCEMDAGNLVLDFGVNNRYATATEISDVRVLNSDRQVVLSEIWRWNDEGVFSARKKVAIAAFQDVRASIYIPNADKQELEPMWVEFRGTRGASPFMASMQVGTFRHMTPEEIEQMQREDELRRQREEEDRQREEERRRREKRAKQISVSVGGLFGAVWVGPGLTSLTDQLGVAGADMSGLGIRATKGLHHYFAFEGELLGGRGGQVSFTDVSWQGMTGDITRQASFGRVQAAGVIRFGTKYVVSTRFGVGFQGTVHESHFTVGETRMEGPGNGFEFDMALFGGLGFDMRLAKRWILGAQFTGGRMFGEMRFVNMGLSLGFAWNPGTVR